MEAERETIDRYVAAYLSTHVGEVMTTRITGVQSFGFFATVEGLGGDGLVPVSTLGAERFRYDEARTRADRRGERRALRRSASGSSCGWSRPTRSTRRCASSCPRARTIMPMRRPMRGKGRPLVGKRGRPAGIRHQGRR